MSKRKVIKTNIFLAYLLILFVLGISALLFKPDPDHYSGKSPPDTFNLTQQNIRHEKFILQLKKDLGITKPVRVFTSYTYTSAFLGRELSEVGSTPKSPCFRIEFYTINFDVDYYSKLTNKEKEAVIVHEMAHILEDNEYANTACYPQTLPFLSWEERIKRQMQADTTSAKYTDVEDIISAINKTITKTEDVDKEGYDARINNLKELQKQKPRK